MDVCLTNDPIFEVVNEICSSPITISSSWRPTRSVNEEKQYLSTSPFNDNLQATLLFMVFTIHKDI